MTLSDLKRRYRQTDWWIDLRTEWVLESRTHDLKKILIKKKTEKIKEIETNIETEKIKEIKIKKER